MSTVRSARRRQALLAVVATFLIGVISAVPVAAADDVAPTVTATTPAEGAGAVSLNATLWVTFSEPVDVAGNWFRVVCAQSSNHLSAAGGGPLTWSIDPINDFVADETCTLTLVAANITDQDAPADSMAEDVVVSFTVASATPPPGGDPVPGSGSTITFKVPVKALPDTNEAQAGSHVHIGFHVDGDQVRQGVSVGWQAYVCGTTPPDASTVSVDSLDPTVVQYQRHKNTYGFGWKTVKAWKDSCRVLVVELEDGQRQATAFRFN